MYDRYSFTLNWDELPEELREEKLDQYLTREYENEGEQEQTLEEYLEDPERRASAERCVEAYFPMYF